MHSAAQVGKRTSALCSRRAAVPRSRCSKTDSNSDCLCPWCRSALQSQGSCCGRTNELLVVGAHQFTVRLTIPAQLRILSLCGLNSTKTAKGLHVPAVPVAEAGFKRCLEGWDAAVHRPPSPLNAQALESCLGINTLLVSWCVFAPVLAKKPLGQRGFKG